MLATVTNKGRGPRGFATLDQGIVMLDAEASALLDLADHLLHKAWEATGEALIAPLTERDGKAARRRLEQEAATREVGRTEALAALPSAGPKPPPA